MSKQSKISIKQKYNKDNNNTADPSRQATNTE